MRAFDTNGGERVLNQPTLTYLKDAFRHVYDFILVAVQHDEAAATDMFQKYLAGELSEEFLSISQRWVNAEQERERTAEASTKVRNS